MPKLANNLGALHLISRIAKLTEGDGQPGFDLPGITSLQDLTQGAGDFSGTQWKGQVNTGTTVFNIWVVKLGHRKDSQLQTLFRVLISPDDGEDTAMPGSEGGDYAYRKTVNSEEEAVAAINAGIEELSQAFTAHPVDESGPKAFASLLMERGVPDAPPDEGSEEFRAAIAHVNVFSNLPPGQERLAAGLVRYGYIEPGHKGSYYLTDKGAQCLSESVITDKTAEMFEPGFEDDEEPPSLGVVESFKMGERSVLAKMIPAIEETIQLRHPSGFMNVQGESTIMDSITIRFATTPRREWPNGIFQNAEHIIILISEKDRRYETGYGPYVAEAAGVNKCAGVRFVKKTGTKEQILQHLDRFFARVAEVATLRQEAKAKGQFFLTMTESNALRRRVNTQLVHGMIRAVSELTEAGATDWRVYQKRGSRNDKTLSEDIYNSDWGVELPVWKHQVEEMFERETGCTWADLNGDDRVLEQAWDRGDAPEDFVSWFVDHYGLDRVNFGPKHSQRPLAHAA